MRPAWSEYFFEIARVVASRASCPRAKVGAVIVSPDNRLLATGYNGAPTNQPDCLTDGCDVQDNHCQRALHAEVNAIGYAAQYGVPVKGARLYVTKEPCRECDKVIAAVGLEVLCK